MYLSNIKLWRFRKFGSDGELDLARPDLDLCFSNGLNVLIGENDSGKSAIIDAIRITLRTHSYEWIRITDDDFYSESTRFRIELRFDDLADNEAKHFTEWLGWTGDGNDATPYLRVIYDVSRRSEDNRILPSDVRAGVDDDGYQLPAEAREYLKVTYLKPLRDAQTELVPKRNSRLSQILQGHEAFRVSATPHYLVSLFDTFNRNIESYFDGMDSEDQDLADKRGKQLKEEIDDYIRDFYDRSKDAKFAVSEDTREKGKLQKILEKLELSIRQVVNPGLGTQNRLFMASELLHLNKENWDGVRIGLIEELEAHLHPQAQMQVIESLQNQDSIQLILTTHSPSLASKVRLDNLIICNNSTAFPMGETFTKLDPDDYKFLEMFLDATKANLFFARGVILVEGWAEELLIPAFAAKLKVHGIIEQDLTEAGVSVVNVGSTAFLRYSKVFLRKTLPEMNIPVSVITDVDIRAYERIPKLAGDGAVEKDENGNTVYEMRKRPEDEVNTESSTKTNELKHSYDHQKVKVFVAPHWTLEYTLSKSASLAPLFEDVVRQVHSRLPRDDFEKRLAEKLILKTLDKTEVAYRLAHKLMEDMGANNAGLAIGPANDTVNYIIEAIKYASGN